MNGNAQAARPNLVLIHGWGLGNAAWNDALPALGRRFRLHRLALPGYTHPEVLVDKGVTDHSAGESRETANSALALRRPPLDTPSRPAISAPLSFIRLASEWLEALPPEACVCGWSLGAELALLIASLAPEKIRRLILVAGTPCFVQRQGWPSAQPPSLLDSFADAVTNDAAATRQRFVALINQGDKAARRIGRTLAAALRAEALPPIASLREGLDWLREVDLRALIPQIAVPTQLIHGQNDPLMPLAAAKWLQERLPTARLDVFAGAAHAPFLHDPERFAARIGDFCHATGPA